MKKLEKVSKRFRKTQTTELARQVPPSPLKVFDDLP